MLEPEEYAARVRETAPLVHCITNGVSLNDCANILLACGASPIMADDPEEVEEITARCGGLVLNLGMLHREKIPALLRAGKQANALGRPVVLDPVGVGGSRLRREAARQLLAEVGVTALRCNGSELRALARGEDSLRGVDADRGEEARDHAALAREFAARTGMVVAVTGETDVVTDGTRLARVRNGHPMMGKITGTGCMLSALVGAFLAAAPEQPWEAVTAGVALLGLCGENAVRRLGQREGTGSMRQYLLDEVCCLTGQELKEGARIELC